MKKYLCLLFVCLYQIGIAQTPLEQFLSHPIESNFASTSDGKNIAWVINDHDKRNVMIKVGNELPRLLTDYQQDDGQEISQLVFSPNGTKLVFVRGGGVNSKGQNPNPASLTEGVDQSLYVKDIASKNPAAKITQGNSPVFYPDGLKILFSKGGQIYETSLDINTTPKLLFVARGSNYGPKFSPSGNDVLFTSDRGDHSFIGIYNIVTKKMKWLAPDVSNDELPVWSPDGKQIAFIRTSGTKINELINFLAGRKFSVWVGNADDLTAKQIWKSPGEDGGFAQSYPSKPLTWSSSNRILFHSEHTGWSHVFSMNPDGSDVKDITPGDGEVESYTLDATGQNIYFDGNREDIDRRHLWKASVNGGTPTAVTSGDGIEIFPAFGGANLYCFRSTINTSKQLVRVEETKKVTVAVNLQKSPTFSSAYFVKPEQVIFKAADGTTIHGQLFIDRKITGKRAGIVYMHGGPSRQMLLGFHYSDYYINCYAFNQYMASLGYAVVSVNYRNGIGYGKDFRTQKNQGPRGAVEYQDVVAAAKFLQLLPEVDAAKIGLWGGSYGGYLTAMGLARNPEIFKAGVDLHGVHDWSFDAHDATDSWGIGKNEKDLALKSSPVADLSKWTAPVLFVHGDDDRNVQFQQTTDLATKLREKNIPVEVLVLPDEIHGFLRYESWDKIFTAAKDFFDRKLK